VVESGSALGGASWGEWFWSVVEASRSGLEDMMCVIILSGGYVGEGGEGFRIVDWR
jgi:hypothetical protein